MGSSFRRLQAWYRAPAQELLRWEAARFRHWIARPGPAAFFCVAFLLTGLRVAQAYISLKAYAASRAGGTVLATPNWQFALVWAISLCAHLLPVVAAGGLAWRRSLAPFRQGRLESLALSRLEPSEIWPALLTAPILAGWILAAIAWIGNVVAWLIRPALPFEMTGVSETASTAELALRSAFEALGFVTPLFLGCIHAAAIAAIACAFTLPRRAPAAFVGGLALALLAGGDIPGVLLTLFYFTVLSSSNAWYPALASLCVAYPMIAVLAGAGFLGARRLWRAERRTPRAAMLILLLCIFAGFLAPLWEWLYGSAAARAASSVYRAGFGTMLYHQAILPAFRFAFDLAAFILALRRLRSPELWTRLREEAARD